MTFYDTLAVLFYFGAFCGITYALCVFALSFYRAFRVAIARQRIKRDIAQQIEALRILERSDQERAWASRIRPNGPYKPKRDMGNAVQPDARVAGEWKH
jgi:hypothetical protein